MCVCVCVHVCVCVFCIKQHIFYHDCGYYVPAIQQALQVQQEDVLSMRSKLLQEYETVLQHRSEGVSQQTEDVQCLQEQMAELQQQYEKQIVEFQARIKHYSGERPQFSMFRVSW